MGAGDFSFEEAVFSPPVVDFFLAGEAGFSFAADALLRPLAPRSAAA
jgi:hypothetical protein